MAAHTPATFRLLAVSREPSVLRLLASLAETRCWDLHTAANGWDAMEKVQSSEAPRLLLLDIPRGDSDSLRLLSWLRRLRPDLAVVALCHPEDSAQQTEAIRLGAKDVLSRPINEGQFVLIAERYFGSPNEAVEMEMASEDIESVGEDEFFLSVSPVMQKLRAQAELLAQADVPVLILGEPGSGKSTVARLIHKLSVHSGFKFQRVNCAQMPGDLLEIELFGRDKGKASASSAAGRIGMGKLEAGEKGTVLLDEVAEMPLPLQARLLQVLEERKFRTRDGQLVDVGVRILAASSQDMNRALAEKRLRPDLYYRLSGFTVHVPPLRERKEELKVLLHYTMHKLARYYGLPVREFSAPALAMCQAHSWPGNLKELEAFIKRYLVGGDKEIGLVGAETSAGSDGIVLPERSLKVALDPQELRQDNSGAMPTLKSLVRSVKSEAERNAIAAALERTGWNRKAAARLLGMSYRTILYKIEQYNMSASDSCVTSFPEPRVAHAGPAKGSGKAS